MALPRLGAINALRSTRLPIAAARRSGPAIRNHSSTSATTGPLASAAYTDAIATSPSSEATSSTPNLPPHHRSTLSSLLRVDHSGEIAANTIYAAQSQVFQHIRRDPASTELTLEMWENEKKHLKVAQMLLDQHRVRPSALNGLWGVMGSALGATTALMGREAAMACTEAVETVIGEHYDDQISHLDEVLSTFRSNLAASQDGHGTNSLSSLETLRTLLEEFRDDELEHLDTAVEHDAQQAPAHALLSAIISVGCKSAIEVAKRI